MVIAAAAQQNAAPAQRLDQGRFAAEQQVVCLSGYDPAAQRGKARGQPGPLGGHQRPDGPDILRLLQRGHTRGLGRGGDRPGLARRPQLCQQGGVGAQAVPQPHPSHPVQLGEGFQDQQAAPVQRPFQGVGGGVGQEIPKALVQNQQGARLPAAVQHPQQQGPRAGQPGGVVGLAEKDHPHPRPDGLQKAFVQPEAVCFPQGVPLHRAAHGVQRGFVLGKGRGRDQRTARPQGQRRPPDQIGRAVAAEDPFRRHPFGLPNGLRQGPAEGVGVAVAAGGAGSQRRRHPRRHPQRADVGRKIQQRGFCAVFGGKAGPVPAVGQDGLVRFSGHIHLKRARAPRRSASPSPKARKPARYSIRFARRMSAGSTGRLPSPMVGLS